MVASGVPEKIDTHAQEICRMALDLLAKVSAYKKYEFALILMIDNSYKTRLKKILIRESG